MEKDIYPSQIFQNWLDFTIYIHQKYSLRNNSHDKLCPTCSKQMVLKIDNNERMISWECPDFQNCKSRIDFHLDESQNLIKHRVRNTRDKYYGFCSCNYDRNGAIFDSTPPELLRKFISVLYWLVNIDENLYSELTEHDYIMISGNESLYDKTYSTFKFPKFYDHGAWGTHYMDPIFLFNCVIRKEQKDLIRDRLPKEYDLEKDKNELWNEVKDFLLVSANTQLYRVKSLIDKMEVCLAEDLKNAIYKIQNLTDANSH